VPVVSRTYATALFEAAEDKGRLEQVREELHEFVTALHDVPELAALLRNPELDSQSKAEALDSILAGADDVFRNFLRIVTEKGRATQIEEIARDFEALWAAQQQVLNVELTTAYELSDADAREIVRQIEQASGRTVEATRSVDPKLIGGIVLTAGSLRVDSSVRGRLERLRRELVTRT
jgi:F-type H+-transporting ATPase subunit delta